MYKNELKGLGLKGIDKMIRSLERSRDTTQKALDLLMTSQNKVNASTKKELKKYLRFCERSINRAEETKNQLKYEEAKKRTDLAMKELRKKMKR